MATSMFERDISPGPEGPLVGKEGGALRRPGFSNRKIRRARLIERLSEEVRGEARNNGEALDEAEISRRAIHRLQELERAHPTALRWYERTAPTSVAPDVRGFHEHIETAAIRRLDETKNLEDILRHAKRGRPTDRRLHMAIYEQNIFGRGRAEISCYRAEFLGADSLRDWAYGDPVRGGSGCSISAVYDTLGKMLDRHDPELALALNLEGVRRLAKDHPEIGRYCVIDGTDVEAPLDQHQSVNEHEELLMTRGMPKAKLGHHDGPTPKTWRGYTVLVISDVKSTLPLAWVLIPASQSEFTAVRHLLDLLFRHWPECPIEYLSSDREFSREADLLGDLEFRYGIHPVFPLRTGAASGKGVPTMGVPECGDHGPMKYIQADNFYGPRGRRKYGIRHSDLSKADTSAHIRYECRHPSCFTRPINTYVRDDPRIFTFLPHRGEHQRAGLREVLMRRQNAAEAVNANLKLRGIGLRGQRHPRWVSTDRQMDWLIGGSLLGMTLRRVAHETGTFERCLAEANDRFLLKPGATGYSAAA